MSPEQTNIPSPIQPEAARPASFWKRKIVWISLPVIFGLIIAGLAGIYFYLPNFKKPADKFTPNTSITGPWHQSNIENVRFLIPEGWAAESASNLSLPSGFKEPAIVLKKIGSSCIIVEAKEDDTFSNTRKQISFADRVFSNYTQFDGNWWIVSTSDSAKYSFSDKTRQYLAGEFRESRNLRNDPFLLFTNDGAAVPDDCNSDFNELLKTIEPYYETVRLSPSSKGILTAEKVWDDVTDTPNKSYEHFVFMADGSKEKREVMRIPINTWVNKFFVSGGKIYVPSNSQQFNEKEKRNVFDSGIYVLDPFTGQTGQISGTIKTDSFISSLYIRNGIAYYLASNSELGTCLDGYQSCAADLYSVPLAGGQPTLIAHSSLGGLIIGYIESEKAFYIMQGWGDAGCGATSINRIVNGKEELVGKFSGCEGENEAERAAFKQMQEKVNAAITRAGASKLLSQGVRIENNTLHPVIGDVLDGAMFYFDKI